MDSATRTQYSPISLLRKSVRGDIVPLQTNHRFVCQVQARSETGRMDRDRAVLRPSVEDYFIQDPDHALLVRKPEPSQEGRDDILPNKATLLSGNFLSALLTRTLAIIAPTISIFTLFDGSNRHHFR
jgi:hypothetical protein